MRYEAQDFARCAGAHRPECVTCLRNVDNSPVHPEARWQTWTGTWVLDTPCEMRVPVEEIQKERNA